MYYTLEMNHLIEHEIVDRKSRFITHISHTKSEGEAKAFLEKIRSENRDARHNVYAYLISDAVFKFSDDGEPKRTSGYPTLEMLQAFHLQQVCCVTTRYFGGVLLGTGGLKRAYSSVVKEALEQAQLDGHLKKMKEVTTLNIKVSYPLLDQVRYILGVQNGRELNASYMQDVSLTVRFLAGEEEAFISQIAELMNGFSPVVSQKKEYAEFN